MKIKGYLAFLVFAVSANVVGAAEPSFCDPAGFSKYEVKYTGNAPDRVHVYKIGQVTMAGMAIGNSDASQVEGVAQKYSTASAKNKYCTWYVNDGNGDAEKAFNWHYLPKPDGSDYKGTGDEWMDIIGAEFDQSALSFVSCGEDFHYIAMGCNGMKHRGPTLFGMILSYVGCTPQHSAEIVNKIWGTNGIKVEMRVALAERAQALAAASPAKAKILRDLFGAK